MGIVSMMARLLGRGGGRGVASENDDAPRGVSPEESLARRRSKKKRKAQKDARRRNRKRR